MVFYIEEKQQAQSTWKIQVVVINTHITLYFNWTAFPQEMKQKVWILSGGRF